MIAGQSSRQPFVKISMNSKEESATNTTEHQTTVFQNIAYALPQLPFYLLIIGPLSAMSGVYVKYFGLSLGAIAAAKMLSRLFDGVTDPLVGYFSDYYQQRFGSRKPLVLVGGILMLLTSTLLYIPYGRDAQHSPSVSFAYFLFFYLALTLSWTVLEIPHLAWAVDISTDKKGRSQRFSFRSMMGYLAPLIFFSIPLLPIFDTTEITPETLEYGVYLAWVLMPLSLWFCLSYVPDPPSISTRKTGQVEQPESVLNETPVVNQVQHLSKKQRFQNAFRMIVDNRPLLIFFLAYAFCGLGMAMFNGLTFFFVDNYLGLAEKLPFVFMVQYGVGIPAAWLWGLVAQKVAARYTWVMGLSLCALGLLGVGFITPGGEASFWVYLLCNSLIGAGFISTYVAGYMVLATIVDHGKDKFGRDCSSVYFAFRTTVFKINAAIGLSLIHI